MFFKTSITDELEKYRKKATIVARWMNEKHEISYGIMEIFEHYYNDDHKVTLMLDYSDIFFKIIYSKNGVRIILKNKEVDENEKIKFNISVKLKNETKEEELLAKLNVMLIFLKEIKG